MQDNLGNGVPHSTDNTLLYYSMSTTVGEDNEEEGKASLSHSVDVMNQSGGEEGDAYCNISNKISKTKYR